MGTTAWRRARLTVAFADAAVRYWLIVFPLVRRELRGWHDRAVAIPDRRVRMIALETKEQEHGNYEGAAAFAAFVPRHERRTVVRAVIAFQLAYDLADSLAEQLADDPVANSRALHSSLLSALSPSQPHLDYFAHSPSSDDGGYLAALVEACRDAVASLPSWDAVADPARAKTELVVEFQALHHADPTSVPERLAAWASTGTPPGSELGWWESAAGGASSSVVFALIAAAAQPSLSPTHVAAVEAVYYPWAGALHVLLDSLVDEPDDVRLGQHSLVAHYASAEAAAVSLGAIASRAFAATEALREGEQHRLLLAAMIALYLSAPTARLPRAAPTRARVLDAAGDLASPTMLVLDVRRAIRTMVRRHTNRN
jgi:tetraprenyl-beta-curcumene synthase